jgi:hypothetical protein
MNQQKYGVFYCSRRDQKGMSFRGAGLQSSTATSCFPDERAFWS